MIKLAELAAKFEQLLTAVSSSISDKLGRNDQAVDSAKLGGKTRAEVIEESVTANTEHNQHVSGVVGQVATFFEEGTVMALRGMNALETVRLCATDSAINNAKNAQPDMAAIFNTWTRISHNSAGVYPALPDELQGWAYDAQIASFTSVINSSSFIGMISNDRFLEYDMECTVKSSGSDDDGVGVIAAFTRSGGREHTFSVMLSPGGLAPTGTHADPTINPLLIIIDNMSQGATYGSETVASFDLGNEAGGWSSATHAAGYKVRIKRFSTGLLEVSCTAADGSPLPNPISWSGMLPAKYLGECSFGICAFSQRGASWTFSKFPQKRSEIIDTRNLNVHKWNGTTWVNKGHMSNFQGLQPGRLYKNTQSAPYTVFYLSHDGNAYIVGQSDAIKL